MVICSISILFSYISNSNGCFCLFTKLGEKVIQESLCTSTVILLMFILMYVSFLVGLFFCKQFFIIRKCIFGTCMYRYFSIHISEKIGLVAYFLNCNLQCNIQICGFWSLPVVNPKRIYLWSFWMVFFSLFPQQLLLEFEELSLQLKGSYQFFLIQFLSKIFNEAYS